ncbi:MAG: SDR family NAD(P)-dependent oxidoreductase [Hyphomicrobiaceae bacterium]
MPQPISKWQNVWITGASTGIGREVALRLARAGTTVAASARSSDKLAELAELEPNIKPYPLDVTDHDGVMKTAEKIKQEVGPLDLVLLNAGTYISKRADQDFQAKDCTHTMAINYNGVTSGVEAVLGDMLKADRGHIAIVASVAGFRGLPRATSYSPTKAALIAFGEALALDLTETKIKLSVINPGFVDTPLTAQNDFPMPFIISSDEAAALIIKGLEREKFDITFPRRMKWLMNFMRVIPNWLYFSISKILVRQQRAAQLARQANLKGD